MRTVVLLTCSFIVIFTAGCGLSSEVLAVTMVAQTDLAATQTRASVPSNTPTPTNTPTPSSTPTPTFTPTPIPDPDPAAALDWKSLNLPSSFTAFSPESIGIGPGAVALSLELGDTPKTYTIEKSFAFRNQDGTERIYGYTALFRTSEDKEIFDIISERLGETLPLRNIEDLQIDNIGSSAAGVTGIRDSGQRLDHIQFRLGSIGISVYSQYPDGGTPSVSVEDIAKVYADSILNPKDFCTLISITSVDGETWPSYEFVADGFYPGEARVSLLDSELQIDNELLHVAQANGLGEEPEAFRLAEDRLFDLGLDMFTFNKTSLFADNQGKAIGRIFLPTVEGAEVTLPEEFIFSVFGLYSGCEIVQNVPWPLSATSPDPVTLTPTPPADTGSDSFSDIDPSGNAIPMRLVSAGEFTMGSDKVDEAISECEKYREHCEPRDFTASTPLHQVELDAFYMDQYEVTNYLYKACADASVCDHPTQYDSGYIRKEYYEVSEFDNYPVIYVDWDMASAYCEWRGARLPSEAEWEKAARGTDGRTFPWGESLDCNKANYRDFAQGKFCVGDTTEVGSHTTDISPYGIYDMAGNVSEWVADWFTAYPGNTIGNEYFGTTYRVWRGDSWYGSGGFPSLGLPSRGWGLPDSSNFATGFRCVRSP